nr:retrovirus-related Pol polyprotein from transposon TNT 1-94 [Tanacetum cinerariifolium]
MEVAHMGNDPLLGVSIPEVTSEQSSSTASPQSNVQPNHPMTHHNSKWTKDHPVNNIIEAMATSCFTQNHSIIRLRHEKTPYELLHNKLPDLSFFHLFGALCYPTNDSENLGKLQPKADIGIFIGYALTKKAFRIYNRRTRRIVKTIHVDFDELTVGERVIEGPEMIEVTNAKVAVAKEKRKEARTSQKSYADKHRRALEFQT